MNTTQTPLDAAAELAATISIDDLPLPYLEIDAHGFITRANSAALALHHPDQGELIGRSAWDLVAIDEKDTSFAAFVSMVMSGKGPEVVHRSIFDRSGRFRTYEMHRSLIRDEQNKVAGVRMTFIDVTEARKALEEAQRARQWLESILDSMNEAIIATDATGVIVGANSAAEELLGWKSFELLGKVLEEGIQMRSFQAGDKTQVTFAMVLTNRSNGLATLVDRHGRDVIVRVWASPILDKKNGSVAGVVLLMYRPGAPLMVPG
jgi:PAS domain S-box-containing protein